MGLFLITYWPLLFLCAGIFVFGVQSLVFGKDSYIEQNVYFEPELETSGEYIRSHDPHDSAPVHSAVQVRIYQTERGWSYKIYEDHRFKPLDEERSSKLTKFLKGNPNLVKGDATIIVPLHEEEKDDQK